MRALPPTPHSLDLAVAVLAAGGIVIHPTETCYGIACDLTNSAAVARLFVLKQRPGNQPVSALFSSITQAKRYVLWNSKADPFVRQHLPGPLTLILPMRPNAPHRLHTTPSMTSEPGHRTEDFLSESRSPSFETLRGPLLEPEPRSRWQTLNGNPEVRTLGIRISSHPVAQKLATLFDRPISTTSANISGKPPTYSVEEIVAQFGGLEGMQDILVLDAGPLPRRSPSTIMDVTGASPREVRKGALSTETGDA